MGGGGFNSWSEAPGGGGGGVIKKQTNANRRQCTPQQGISTSLFSMPNLVKH